MFEDTIVDFFESADIKGDHVLDEDEFREVGQTECASVWRGGVVDVTV